MRTRTMRIPIAVRPEARDDHLPSVGTGVVGPGVLANIKNKNKILL